MATEYVPLPAQTGPSVTHKRKDLKARTAWERIGSIGIVILLLGSIVLLAPVSLLAVIWKRSTDAVAGGPPLSPWITILNANWLTGVVTICTAVIRLVIALQVSQTTAMIAGVILEAVGTPLIDAPYLSMIRAVSTTPNNLLYPFRLQPLKSFLSFCIFLLVILQITVAVASQFLSTILVSDFGSGTFTSPSNTTEIPIMPYNLESLSWWSNPPAAAWTFAEHSEPFIEGSDYHDTGHTYRAIPLFETESQRISLQEYHGQAPVMDNRVICASPVLANLTLDINNGARLQGHANIANDSYLPLGQDEPQPRYQYFDCALPYGPKVAGTGGESSLCRSLFTIDTFGNTSEPLTEFPSFDVFFILDALDRDFLTEFSLQTVNLRDTRREGPWTIIDGSSSSRPAVRITACLTDPTANTFVIDMHRSRDGTEPRVSWNRKTQSYNTIAIRHQLGASQSPYTPQARGLLTLTPRSDWKPYDYISADSPGSNKPQAGIHTWSFAETLPTVNTDTLLANQSLADQTLLLSLSSTEARYNAHASHVHLFQDILRETESPALAAQALLTRSFQTAYYETLPRVNQTLPVEVAFATTQTTPVRWTGFAVGMAIIAVHLGIVVVFTVMFVCFTRSSFTHETWQAVEQVAAGDVISILKEVEGMKDEEVERWGVECEPRLREQVFMRYRG
ncbi:hypothetical protein BJY04DRAFT_220201 [Aspergillus karnatakaensis]|uniref:uncharacterized protein n=1 Tax=Aspergillus karnatakaensis TaxID=1810916 RepID=UPI003CCDA2DA